MQLTRDVSLVILSVVLMVGGGILLFYIGKKNGYTDFLGTAHWVSLVLLLIAGIATWVAMVWIKDPDEFHVSRNQWVSLGTSILISILWWARYVYIVTDDSKSKKI